VPCDLVLEGPLNSMQIWESRSQICVVMNFDAPPEEDNSQVWEYVVTDEYIGRTGYVRGATAGCMLYRCLELWYTRFTVYICSG
jgi:hypothetical protein